MMSYLQTISALTSHRTQIWPLLTDYYHYKRLRAEIYSGITHTPSLTGCHFIFQPDTYDDVVSAMNAFEHATVLCLTNHWYFWLKIILSVTGKSTGSAPETVVQPLVAARSLRFQTLLRLKAWRLLDLNLISHQNMNKPKASNVLHSNVR